MAKSSARKLVDRVGSGVPNVPRVPGSSRRSAYSASTKRALIDVAQEMFAERGYANTSLDAVVSGAQVTKGALYHHFNGKAALFEAVFEQIEAQTAKTIRKAVKGVKDPWAKAEAGLSAFMEVVQEPGYRRVVIQEGPAVLGYERFREQEERSTYAIVVDLVRSILDAGSWRLEDEMLHTFARIFFGTLSAAGGVVAAADDPEESAARVETAVGFLLQGIRGMVESDDPLPADILGYGTQALAESV